MKRKRKTSENMNNSSLSSTNIGSSPGQRLQDSESSEPSSTCKFIFRIKSDVQVQKHQKRTNQELHLKRVQNLRKELEYLKATEWKYQPVDRNLDQTRRN